MRFKQKLAARAEAQHSYRETGLVSKARDYSKLILFHITDDLRTRQSADDQHQQSRGGRASNTREVATKAAEENAGQ